MVQNLHNNLIIAPELADMRRRLKNLESKDGQVLFVSLYNSWCHNAVATFSLCLLAQAYEHASNLLQSLYVSRSNRILTNGSGDLEITVQFLIQVDKLVQILESPVFTCMHIR
jgi:vacuole morphology and inheritance protein 14